MDKIPYRGERYLDKKLKQTTPFYEFNESSNLHELEDLLHCQMSRHINRKGGEGGYKKISDFARLAEVDPEQIKNFIISKNNHWELVPTPSKGADPKLFAEYHMLYCIADISNTESISSCTDLYLAYFFSLSQCVALDKIFNRYDVWKNGQFDPDTDWEYRDNFFQIGELRHMQEDINNYYVAVSYPYYCY